VACASKTAIVWGSEGPVDAVLYFEPADDDPTDSGFSLLRADAPKAGPESDTACRLYCLDCVLDEEPGIGPGLDLARMYGGAELGRRGWLPRGGPGSLN
jgi:hypothetical protein